MIKAVEVWAVVPLRLKALMIILFPLVVAVAFFQYIMRMIKELPALIDVAGAEKISTSDVIMEIPVVPGAGVTGVPFFVKSIPINVFPPSVEYPAATTILADVSESPVTVNEKLFTEAL